MLFLLGVGVTHTTGVPCSARRPVVCTDWHLPLLASAARQTNRRYEQVCGLSLLRFIMS